MKFIKKPLSEEHIGEDGSCYTKKVVYKTFVTYDAKVFLDVFYSAWLPDGMQSEAKFVLCDTTAKLLDAMELFKEVDNNFCSVKNNWLGRPCAIGDKMMYKATKYMHQAVNATLQDVEEQRDFFGAMFMGADSKKLQDYALNCLTDKIAEAEALQNAIEKSMTTRYIFNKKERKEIMADYFDRINNSEMVLEKHK